MLLLLPNTRQLYDTCLVILDCVWMLSHARSCVRRADGGGDAELDQAFRLFDQDGDGYVDLSEARKYLSNCGSRPLENEEMEEFFASLEIDGQDRISIDAFKAMACWQVPSPKQMEQAETASRLGGSSSTVTVGSVHGHALNRKSGRLDHPSSPAKQISPAKQPSQLGQAR